MALHMLQMTYQRQLVWHRLFGASMSPDSRFVERVMWHLYSQHSFVSSFPSKFHCSKMTLVETAFCFRNEAHTTWSFSCASCINPQTVAFRRPTNLSRQLSSSASLKWVKLFQIRSCLGIYGKKFEVAQQYISRCELCTLLVRSKIIWISYSQWLWDVSNSIVLNLEYWETIHNETSLNYMAIPYYWYQIIWLQKDFQITISFNK